MATPKNKTTKPKKKGNAIIRAQVGNPCDDQNGMVLCWGGHLTNFPFPTSGGPFAMVVAYNAQTALMELQFADLATLCPGNVAAATPTQTTEPKPCGGCE